MSVRKSLLALAALTIVALHPIAAVAQQSDAAAYSRLARDAAALSRTDAEGLEAALNDRPDDLAARAKLLGSPKKGWVDYFPLAEAFLGCARDIDPANAASVSTREEDCASCGRAFR